MGFLTKVQCINQRYTPIVEYELKKSKLMCLPTHHSQGWEITCSQAGSPATTIALEIPDGLSSRRLWCVVRALWHQCHLQWNRRTLATRARECFPRRDYYVHRCARHASQR